MTTDPTQPLTDDELDALRHRVLADYVDPDSDDPLMEARMDRCVLLSEIERLRAENTAMAEVHKAELTAILAAFKTIHAKYCDLDSQKPNDNVGWGIGAVDECIDAVEEIAARALGLDQDGGEHHA